MVISEDGWSYQTAIGKTGLFSLGSTYTALGVVFIFFFALTLLSANVFFSALALMFFTPLFYAPNAMKAWPWAAAGVMLALAGAWGGIGFYPDGGCHNVAVRGALAVRSRGQKPSSNRCRHVV